MSARKVYLWLCTPLYMYGARPRTLHERSLELRPERVAHKPSRSEMAADAIAKWIFDGSLRPGDQMIEEDLARRLDMSRVPVREALRELSREGLVRVIPRRGAFVAPMDGQEVAQTYDVRAVLEGFGARLCAEHINPKALAELQDLLSEMHGAVSKGELDEYSRLTVRFKASLWEHIPNRALFELIRQLGRRSLKLRLIAMRLPGRAEQSLASYESLIEAIRRRDGRAAEMVRWLGVQQAKHALIRGYFGEARYDRRSQLERDLPTVDIGSWRLELPVTAPRRSRSSHPNQHVAVDRDSHA